jgi:hypothetical protein
MIYQIKNVKSLAASAENKKAEEGGGGKARNGRKGSPCIEPCKMGETYTLLDVNGPGVIRHIWITVPFDVVSNMRNLIIRMYWDHQETPSVEVPLGDFFGVSFGRQSHMVSECVTMQSGKGLNCWIPMPFQKHAKITVENDATQDVSMLFYQIDFTQGDELDDESGYFHAHFRRSNPCPMHEDYVILDQVQGRGVYLGTVIGIRSLFKDSWYGEGEVKFYIDKDEEYPTICGTGLEDYVGSAWGLDEVLTPQQGAPLIDNENGFFSMYRFHTKDPIYFQTSLKVTLQQIGWGSKEAAQNHYGDQFVSYRCHGEAEDSLYCIFERSDDISSVAYWYQCLPTVPFRKFPNRDERVADLD